MADAPFQKSIEDIIECPICTDTLKNTRVLPCIHTFCLQCITEYGKDKRPGDTMRCPCCRKEFRVPKGGFGNLPKNTLIEKVLEVQCAAASDSSNSNRLCTMPCHGKKRKNQSLATWHCVECEQHMCSSCRQDHLKHGGTSFHHVLPDQKANFCQEHPDRQLDKFCKTCKTRVCGKCCDANHKRHDCSTLFDYARTLQQEIDELRLQDSRTSSRSNSCYACVTLPSDISRYVYNTGPLHQHNRREITCQCGLHPVSQVDIHCLRCRTVFCTDSSIFSRVEPRSKSHEDKSKEVLFVIIVLMLAAVVWQMKGGMDEERKNWTSEKNNYKLSEEKLKRQFETLEAERKQDLIMKELECEKSKQILKHRLEKLIAEQKQDLMMKELECEKSKQILKQRLEKLIGDPVLSKTAPIDGRAVVAMTLIDDNLLIANSRNGNLRIFDLHSLASKSDWAILPSSTAAGMGFCKKSGHVFVSTWNRHILKFSRNGQKLAQWSVETASGCITVTSDCNVILAVRDNSRKILTHSADGKLIAEVEMKADIRESRLLKAVQISKGRYIVSYGGVEDSMHGLDMVNANGHTLKTYGRKKDPSFDQLRDPCDFVVDRLGNVLVADYINGRILLLNSELKLQRELVSTKHGLRIPFGILLNEFDNVLYVADNQWEATGNKLTDGRIMVFEIK